MTENISAPYEYLTFRKDFETGIEIRIDPIPEGSWGHQMSPEGTKLVYNYDNGTSWYRIGLYDLITGTAATLTTAADIDEWEPALSKDGTKVVFDSDRGDGFSDAWIHDLPSGELSRVTWGFDAYSPELSADNQTVSFVTWGAATNYQTELYLVETGGATPVLLDDDIDWSVYYPSVEWSPQADKLAFSANRDGVYDIYIFDADTEETSRLTDNESTEIYLQWSPDGKYLSCLSVAALL